MLRKAAAFVICLIMVLSLMGSASAQERPDAPTYAVRGVYAVGTTELVLEDADRPLDITMWYPALNPDDLPQEIVYTLNYPPPFGGLPVMGRALQDAAPDYENGPYPLVVFSHGLNSTRMASPYYYEHLASHGFVVMAVDHFGETLANMGEPFWAHYYYRPLDMTRAIAFADELTAEAGEMAGLIDVERIAVTGTSSGGWTALAAGGGQISMGELQAWCDDYADTAPFDDCGEILPHADEIAAMYGMADNPTAPLPAIYDERVDAVIALAPDTNVLGPSGFAAIRVPTMIMVGSHDTVVIPEINAYPRYADLGSEEKALVVFEHGDHTLSFSACDAMPWATEFGFFWVCSDAVWDMDRAHDLTNHFATAFLLAHLYDDAEAAAALAPDAVNFPGITYETTVQ